MPSRSATGRARSGDEPSKPATPTPMRRSASRWTGPMKPPPMSAAFGYPRTTRGELMVPPSKACQAERDAGEEADHVRGVRDRAGEAREAEDQPEEHDLHRPR